MATTHYLIHSVVKWTSIYLTWIILIIIWDVYSIIESLIISKSYQFSNFSREKYITLICVTNNSELTIDNYVLWFWHLTFSSNVLSLTGIVSIFTSVWGDIQFFFVAITEIKQQSKWNLIIKDFVIHREIHWGTYYLFIKSVFAKYSSIATVNKRMKKEILNKNNPLMC